MIQNIDFSDEYKEKEKFFIEFAKKEIKPLAKAIDAEQKIPDELIKKMVDAGVWCGEIPKKYGGADMDMVTYGLLSEQVGKACANMRNIMGVQGMVSTAVLKWGNEKQRKELLPKMASGKVLGAFALTEPNIGSDVKSIETSAVKEGDYYILNGKKKWITFAQRADIFLLFAKVDDKITAFLVDRNTEGLTVEPIKDLLGFRGSMLGEINLNNCKVSKENVVCKEGLGLAYVAHQSLAFGRFSTAWGSVGLAQACFEECLEYAAERSQFNNFLKNHELIQKKIANMVVNIMNARFMCHNLSCLMEKGDSRYLLNTAIAKYAASTMASKIATDAVQICGANGCSNNFNVERYFRDSKIMEIVEGSTQILETLIAKEAYKMNK